MQLLIPAAKIVTEELQAIGKLPAIIYPVNQSIVFDYLYKQYSQISDSLDIICYENASKVHRRLAGYRDEKINVIDLPELSDLGHTIYYGLKNTSTPVIINFADTIVMDNIADCTADSFYYSEDYFSEKWTYFSMNDGKVEKIIDKPLVFSCSNKKEKLFVGVFYFSDSALLRRCLEQSFEDKDALLSTFYRSIQLYSEIHPMTAIKTENWFDIGHADRYYNSKLEVEAREFNHISIDKNRGILRKSSDNVDKFIGEIEWYLKLPSDIQYVRPRIFSYSTEYSSPYVSMEYYAYHTVHELFLYGDLNPQQWESIFKRILFVCNDFKRYSVEDKNMIPSLEDMYLTKTVQRFKKMKDDERFISFFEKPICINGKKYKSLNRIEELLKEIIPDMLYAVNKFNIIHGDLCFTNIMIDNNFSFVKLIDPRGKFGDYDIYGDPHYELAKLFHSVDGKYDFIIKDLFEVEYDLKEASIMYKIQDRELNYNLYNIFIEVFKDEIGDDLKKIELIEALLFLSMIPLHRESLNHQMVMLGTGLDILNRVVDITV